MVEIESNLQRSIDVLITSKLPAPGLKPSIWQWVDTSKTLMWFLVHQTQTENYTCTGFWGKKKLYDTKLKSYLKYT